MILKVIGLKLFKCFQNTSHSQHKTNLLLSYHAHKIPVESYDVLMRCVYKN